ncbi:MAG: response regulator transcription factor [Oscillospiraceae bacterium]|nr:response regulator transcription factor [Oscillospiraceae bacterium]
MFRLAIVDDEEFLTRQYQKTAADVLHALGIDHEIRTFSSSRLFHEICQNEKFDLVFLDIDMPELSGIDLAADLRMMNKDTGIVFVSAHTHFVFESIRYSPFRYIRKMYSEIEIPEAIRAFLRKYEAERNSLILDLENGKKITVNIFTAAYFYALRHDLFMCNYQKESFRLAFRTYTMEQLEEMMAPFGFIRIHKSYLVNYRCIYQLQTDYALLTLDGEKLPMSRRRAPLVRERYRILLREENDL